MLEQHEAATPPSPFRNDARCSCHEPGMPVTLCSFSGAVDRAFEVYQARKAREAAAKAGPQAAGA